MAEEKSIFRKEMEREEDVISSVQNRQTTTREYFEAFLPSSRIHQNLVQITHVTDLSVSRAEAAAASHKDKGGARGRCLIPECMCVCDM